MQNEQVIDLPLCFSVYANIYFPKSSWTKLSLFTTQETKYFSFILLCSYSVSPSRATTTDISKEANEKLKEGAGLESHFTKITMAEGIYEF